MPTVCLCVYRVTISISIQCVAPDWEKTPSMEPNEPLLFEKYGSNLLIWRVGVLVTSYHAGTWVSTAFFFSFLFSYSQQHLFTVSELIAHSVRSPLIIIINYLLNIKEPKAKTFLLSTCIWSKYNLEPWNFFSHL